MSTAPDTLVRHPLGLPPGSIRTLLALLISGLFVLLLLLPADKSVQVPLFLYFLLSLLLVYMAAHGKSIGVDVQPFHMPKGTFRFLIVAAILATLGWRFSTDRNLLMARLTPAADQLQQWPSLCAALFGGFLVGRLFQLGPWRHSAMFQDVLATLSVLCMIGLGVETLAVLFIGPSLTEGIDLHILENSLTTGIALYFGARC